MFGRLGSSRSKHTPSTMSRNARINARLKVWVMWDVSAVGFRRSPPEISLASCSCTAQPSTRRTVTPPSRVRRGRSAVPVGVHAPHSPRRPGRPHRPRRPSRPDTPTARPDMATTAPASTGLWAGSPSSSPTKRAPTAALSSAHPSTWAAAKGT